MSALYEELINKEVVKAMAEEEAQTSQGLEILAQETEKEVEKLTEKIDREPKAIPGGSKNKAKRRELKKIAHKLRKDFIPRANASLWTLKIFIKEFALVIISSRL